MNKSIASTHGQKNNGYSAFTEYPLSRLPTPSDRCHNRNFCNYFLMSTRISRGYFICGQSPILLAARVTSRWYGLAVAKACYLLLVNEFFSNFPSLVVPLLCPLPTAFVYILVSFLHSRLRYLRSTLCTRIIYFGICISALDIFYRSGYFFLSSIP